MSIDLYDPSEPARPLLQAARDMVARLDGYREGSVTDGDLDIYGARLRKAVEAEERKLPQDVVSRAMRGEVYPELATAHVDCMAMGNKPETIVVEADGNENA